MTSTEAISARAMVEVSRCRQLFGEHDLADLLVNGHGSLTSHCAARFSAIRPERGRVCLFSVVAKSRAKLPARFTWKKSKRGQLLGRYEKKIFFKAATIQEPIILNVLEPVCATDYSLPGV